MRAVVVLAFVSSIAIGCAAAPIARARPTHASLAGASKSPPRVVESRTGDARDVVHVLARDSRFSRFAHELGRTRMAHILHGRGPFVVLAPIDEAFRDVPEDELEPFFATRAATTTVVKHHTVFVDASAGSVVEGGWMRAMDDGAIEVVRRGGGVRVDGCELAGPPLHASNGVVVPLRCLLLPTGRLVEMC